MANMQQIKQSIEPELDALNAIIEQTLHSSSTLTNRIVTRYLRVKGKQIRPILVLLSAKFFGGVNDKALNGGAAIELLHNASLIHDDVIDRSATRRGAATINSVWDNHVAVLVGDFFVSGALKCAVRTGDVRVLNALARLGANLSEGEMDQIDNTRNRDITEGTYMDIINRKTAILFTCCIEVGGLVTQADEEDLRRLMRFGDLLGLAFQIKDDTFDYFDSPEVGKPTGNDLREGKITLPLIHALAQDVPGRDAMLELVHKDQLTDADIHRLVEFAKRNGGIDYAYEVMQRLRRQGDELLVPYASNPVTPQLGEIFSYIIARDK